MNHQKARALCDGSEAMRPRRKAQRAHMGKVKRTIALQTRVLEGFQRPKGVSNAQVCREQSLNMGQAVHSGRSIFNHRLESVLDYGTEEALGPCVKQHAAQRIVLDFIQLLHAALDSTCILS